MNSTSCEHGAIIRAILAAGLLCLLLPQATSAATCTDHTDNLGINQHHCDDDSQGTLRVDLLAQIRNSATDTTWHKDPLGNLRRSDGTVLRKDPAGNWRSREGTIYLKEGIGPVKNSGTGTTWRKDPAGNIRGSDGTVLRKDSLGNWHSNKGVSYQKNSIDQFKGTDGTVCRLDTLKQLKCG